MSDIPVVNTILQACDPGGQPAVAQVDANGRLLVNVSNSVAPSVGPTPPASPNDGDLWFNTAAGQQELYVYDDTRSFWLSTTSHIYDFGADSTDNAALRSGQVNTAGTGSSRLIPLDAMITRIAASARTGNATKGFDIVNDGSAGTSIISSFSLSALQFLDNAAAIQLNANDDLWVNSQAAGGASTDVIVSLYVRWRVAP